VRGGGKSNPPPMVDNNFKVGAFKTISYVLALRGGGGKNYHPPDDGWEFLHA